MTVKRGLEQDPQNQRAKRLRTDDNAPTWPFDCADLNLGHGDLSLQADHFLRQIGVCSGVHAAADDIISGQYGVESRVASYHGWQGLSERTWRCCAELNSLLNLFKHRLGEVPLESYHSWTRSCKAVTYAKLRQHFEQHSQPGSQVQLQMVSHLLGSMVQEQAEVAICKYIFNLRQCCPEWLKSWCLRWGFTTGSFSVLGVDAYTQSIPQLAGFDFLGYPVHVNPSDQAAAMTLYVPCMA